MPPGREDTIGDPTPAPEGRRRRLLVDAGIGVVAIAVVLGLVLSRGGGHHQAVRRRSATPTPTTIPAKTVAFPHGPMVSFLSGSEDGGTVRVISSINPTTGRLGPVIPGWLSAVAPDGSSGVLLLSGSDAAYRVNLVTGVTGPEITVGSAPEAVAFSPSGATAYVADAGRAIYQVGTDQIELTTRSNRVVPLDVSTDTAGRAIRVCQGPLYESVATRSHTLVVACESAVSLVDIDDDRLIRTVRVPGATLGDIAVAPSGEEAAVVTSTGHARVFGLDLRTDRLGAGIEIPSLPDSGALGAGFAATGDVVDVTTPVTAHGGRDLNEVRPVDLATGRVGAPLRLGAYVVVATHTWPDGTTGYLATDPDHPTHLRVATTLSGPFHDIAGPTGLEFTGQFATTPPYLLYVSGHTIESLDLATGAHRLVHCPFDPFQVVSPGGTSVSF